MKSSHYALVFPLLLLIGTFNIALSQQPPEKAAQEAAESWMRLMDSRKHGEAWEASSERLKERVTKKDWESGFNGVKELGDIISRKLLKAELVKSLPGIDNQEGVALRYYSSVEGRTIDEIVEMVFEKDEWRVANYTRFTKPKLLNRLKPDYTSKARSNKVQGIVRLRVRVGTDGKVKEASVIEGLPDGLNEMALETAYRMRFSPAMKNGQLTDYIINVHIEFNIR